LNLACEILIISLCIKAQGLRCDLARTLARQLFIADIVHPSNPT
jgi:hypothetical protein